MYNFTKIEQNYFIQFEKFSFYFPFMDISDSRWDLHFSGDCRHFWYTRAFWEPLHYGILKIAS